MVKISTSISGFEASDRVLDSAPAILRAEVRQALRNAGRLVVQRAKQLVPPPGYPYDKPDLKPLRDTIATEVKDGRKGQYAVVGPKRPAGSHGHLVEGITPVRHHSHGEPTGVILEPKPFLGPAATSTKTAQVREIRKILEQVDQKIGRLLR